MTTRRSILIAGASAVLVAGASLPAMAQAPRLTVGGKAFTEQLLIAEMTAILLTARGFSVDKRTGMATNVVREAQVNGQVDVYWEYTGTSLINFNKVTEKLDRAQTLARVREMDAKVNLIWLNPSNTNNTFTLVVRADEPKTANINTISQLGAAFNGGANLTMSMSVEFSRRDDGLPGLSTAYGFQVPRANVRAMETGLVFNAIRDKQVDVATGNGTDGRIAAFGLRALVDDKNYFPTYALAPVVRKEILDRHPNLKDILEGLAARIDDSVLRRLNSAVDVDRKTVEEVARGFLREAGIVS